MGQVLSEPNSANDEDISASFRNIEGRLQELRTSVKKRCRCEANAPASLQNLGATPSTPELQGNTILPVSQTVVADLPSPRELETKTCEARMLNQRDMRRLEDLCASHKNPHGVSPHGAMGVMVRKMCEEDTQAHQACGQDFDRLTRCIVEHKCDLAAPLPKHKMCDKEMTALEKCTLKHDLPNPWSSK